MSFDPYHRWLGIPPEEQPAHHYRLLGIKPFEDQPEVIESAADRQMVHLRNHQAGVYSALSQKLLNEVAAARVCLLSPERKAEYDRALRERLERDASNLAAGQPEVGRGKLDVSPLPDPALAQLFDKTAHAPAHAPAATSARAPQAARRAKQTQLWASIGIVAVGIVVVAIILIRAAGSSNETAKPEGPAPAVQPERPKPRAKGDSGTPVSPTPGKEVAQSPSASPGQKSEPEKPMPKGTAGTSAPLERPKFVRNVRHDAMGKAVALAKGPDAPHAGTGPACLTDGKFAEPDPPAPGWLGFSGNDMEATIDLGSEIEIRCLGANFLQATSWGTFIPFEITFAVSGDGTEFRPIKTVKPSVPIRERGPLAATLTADDLKVRGRYVRVSARNVARVPEWHRAKGTAAWLFVDEILVNPAKGGSAQDDTIAPAEKSDRLPVPAQAEREKALAQLNEVYELSKDRAAAEKRKLAADLLDLAEKAKERPAERYVLLENAMRLEGEGGDAAKMLELAGQLAAEFEIDPLAAKAAALKTFADGAKDSARIRALVEATEKLIDEALGQDKYELAQELADRAYAACQATAGREFRKRAFDRRNEVQALTAAWKEVQAALDKLKTDANDAAANLTAGRYFAFQKGDWRKGLAMLALGSDATLKDLAAKEIKGAESPDEQLALADAWWDAAEKAQGQERDAMRLHAGSWYQETEASVTSTLLKAKIQKRLEEIGKLGRPIPELPARKPPPAVAPFDEAAAKRHQERWAKYLNVPVVGANSIGTKLVLIPPGEFEMGSSKEEIERLIEEAKRQNAPQRSLDLLAAQTPSHRVKITKPFCLGVCEVTQGEYERVMGSNPSQFKGDPNRPVEMVTWNEAVEFCRKLSESPKEKAAGTVYRLPTEAEWEYACRAGTTTRYSFGDDEALLGRHAWWRGTSQATSHPGGHLQPNHWGLFDMHGNVWEWCADWWSADYYGRSPTEAPTGADSGSSRVFRGGSWRLDEAATYLRCGQRYPYRPDGREPNVGFRVSMTVAPGSVGLRPASAPQASTALTPGPAPSAPTFADWLQDFEAAKQEAARENKDILIAFDGSDWCSWSQRMASDIFLKPEFRQKADKDFVLVFIDFPAKAEAKARVQDSARNKKLAELFEVEGYPTVVLADALGRPYGVEGYVRGGVDAFAERVARWRAVKAKRDEAFAAVGTTQAGAKLKAVRKAVAVLQEMDREVSGLGLMRFYEPALAEWLELAKKLDPANAAGDLEVVFSTVWMARLDAAGQHGDARQLDEIVRQLDEWKKGFKFKDPDQAVMLYLRAASVLLAAGRGTDAARFIEEAANYKPNDPALAWILERAARSMTEGFAFGHGTGFVVAAGGYILTNHHVIAGPGRLSVQLSPDPRDRVPAQLVAKDEKGDMALLKIDVPKGRMLTPLAISGAEVRRGMRIGAFGYGGAGDVGTGIKLTQGIVSSLPDKSTEGMIVLDCRVNPGNSGGPLCDTRGNVIGMIRAKSLSTEEFESYGMALPAENLKGFLAQHLPKGHKAPEAPSSEKTREWDEIDRVVSGSVLKVVKGM